MQAETASSAKFGLEVGPTILFVTDSKPPSRSALQLHHLLCGPRKEINLMTGHKSTKCTTQIVAMFHFDLEAAAIPLCQPKVRCHFLLKDLTQGYEWYSFI